MSFVVVVNALVIAFQAASIFGWNNLATDFCAFIFIETWTREVLAHDLMESCCIVDFW